MEEVPWPRKRSPTLVTDQLIHEGNTDIHKDVTTPSASRNFFRALGLSIVNYYLGHIGHRDFQEPAKFVIERSHVSAMVRNVIHIVPISAAVAVIYLNLAGLYIGAHLKNINALQFAAKLHELTMIASLAQILFATVRAELVSENGLPFGALFSGLQITQLSHLWSMEFWGSATAPSFTFWKKSRIVLIPMICMLLAATVGPSSAIALIPRAGFWPAGRTHIWLNGTNEAVFPTELDGRGIPTNCMNGTTGVPIQGLATSCPSDGWQTIAGLAPFYRYDLGPENSNWPNVGVLWKNAIGAPSVIQLAGQNALRSLDLCAPIDCTNYLATTQPGAIANALVTIATFWTNSISSVPGRLRSHRTFNHSVESLQPFVAVDGGSHTYTIEGPDDNKPIPFRSGISRGGSSSSGDTLVNATSISRSELYNIENPTVPNLVFVDLTDTGVVGTKLGAVLLRSRAYGEVNQTFTTILVSAGWGLSKLQTSPNSGETLSKVVQSSGFTAPFNEDFKEESDEVSDGHHHSFPDFPLKMIMLSKEWADFTNPFLPEMNTTVYGALSSVVETLYNTTGDKNAEGRPNQARIFTKTLLAALIANGISNMGLDFSLQGNTTKVANLVNGNPWILHNKDLFTVDPLESANWVRLQVNSTVEGLQYSTSGLPIKIALSILIAYCVIAITYVLYTSITGVSSSSWDTIAELTALAVNSPPSRELRNTCAGIANMKLFKMPVRVLSTYEAEKAADIGAGHLQLVFGEDGKDVSTEAVKANTKYGLLAQHGLDVEYRTKPNLLLRKSQRRYGLDSESIMSDC